MYFSLSVQRRLLAVSTVLDNCAWAVPNIHVDLPTLANWHLCNVYAPERLSPRLTSSLYVSFFFSIFYASVYCGSAWDLRLPLLLQAHISNLSSKKQKRVLRRKCLDKFKVKRGCLYHSNDGQVDWKEVPRDHAHVERIPECCHSSLEGKCLAFSITKRLDH